MNNLSVLINTLTSEELFLVNTWRTHPELGRILRADYNQKLVTGEEEVIFYRFQRGLTKLCEKVRYAQIHEPELADDYIHLLRCYFRFIWYPAPGIIHLFNESPFLIIGYRPDYNTIETITPKVEE